MREENKMQGVFVERISKCLTHQKYYHLLAAVLFIAFEVKAVRDFRAEHPAVSFQDALPHTYPAMVIVMIAFILLIPFILFKEKIESRLICAIEFPTETQIKFTVLNNTSFEFAPSEVSVKKKEMIGI